MHEKVEAALAIIQYTCKLFYIPVCASCCCRDIPTTCKMIANNFKNIRREDKSKTKSDLDWKMCVSNEYAK